MDSYDNTEDPEIQSDAKILVDSVWALLRDTEAAVNQLRIRSYSNDLLPKHSGIGGRQAFRA